MPRANVIQTNFTSGELSPQLMGRIDVNKYFNGARLLENVFVRPQGAVERCPATRFVTGTKDNSKRAIVQDFIFSDIQAYVLEFGDGYMRVMKDGGVVESSPGVPLEVTTPWGEAYLSDLYFAQSADVLFVCHPLFQTRKISRTSHTSWTVSLYDPDDGPYLQNAQTQRLTAALLQDVATATAIGGTPFTASTLKTITAIGQSGFFVEITSAAHGFSNGTLISISGVLKANGTTSHINGQWTISGVSTNTFKLSDGGLNGCVFQNGDQNSILTNAKASTTLGTYLPYREDNLWKLSKVLSAVSTSVALVDVVDQVLQLDQSIKITGTTAIVADKAGTFQKTDENKYIRTTAGVWVKLTSFTDDQHMVATVLTTVAYSYPSVRINIADRKITGYVQSDTAVFTSTDVGRCLRMRFLTTIVWGRITLFESSTQVQMDFSLELPRDPNNADILSLDGIPTEWFLGAWSDTTGWPSVVTFHKGRIWFFKTTFEPASIWGSMVGDFDSHAPTNEKAEVLADNGISLTLASGRANPIVWAESSTVLLIGTVGGEWQVKPSSITEALAPSNIEAVEQTTFGSQSSYRPMKIGSATLFAQRGGKKLREMLYSFEIDSFTSKDISLLGEHLLQSRIIKSVIQKEPVATAWLLMADGKLIGCTYEKDQEVVAFFRRVTGGIVESIACVPDGSNDSVYAVIRRTINGGTKRYIERLEQPFDGTMANMFFAECGLTYSGSPATTISGLSHLEGSVVDVVADGAYIGTKTVSGGSFTLTSAASVVQVGLPSSATILTTDPEGGSASGTSQGKLRRIDKVEVRVRNTLPFKFGMNLSSLLDLPPDITAASLINDDVHLELDQSWQRTGGFYIKQEKPYPLNIVAIMSRLNTNE